MELKEMLASPEAHLWTPPLMQAFLWTARGMWSGAVICPAS